VVVLGLVDGAPGVYLAGVHLAGVQGGNVPRGGVQPPPSPGEVYAESVYAHGFHHFTAHLCPVCTLLGSSCVNTTFHI